MTNQKPIELPAWAEFAGTDERGTYTIVNLSGVRFRMRWIEPGTFVMGSPEDEDGRYDDETQHEVALTQGYWIAETQCTQELWQAVMGENPSRFRGERRPVENVSWEDCQRFIQRANELAPGLDLRLPTEAEWEHACRAVTTGARYGELDNVAWHHGNSESTTHPVGQKVPNAWGLYDMLGNVWEWCADWFGEYPDRAAIDPKGPEEGTFRVLRGGSWVNGARNVRSASRYHSGPAYRSVSYGVRFARGPKPGEPSGERRENRRADAGGESVASSEATNDEVQQTRDILNQAISRIEALDFLPGGVGSNGRGAIAGMRGLLESHCKPEPANPHTEGTFTWAAWWVERGRKCWRVIGADGSRIELRKVADVIAPYFNDDFPSSNYKCGFHLTDITATNWQLSDENEEAGPATPNQQDNPHPEGTIQWAAWWHDRIEPGSEPPQVHRVVRTDGHCERELLATVGGHFTVRDGRDGTVLAVHINDILATNWRLRDA